MHKIAVYGSLRKGMHNHTIIEDAKYLGKYETKPAYDLYAISSFPGLKAGGSTSVVMEVYEVDDATLALVDRLEGYDPNSKKNNFYNRVNVETPYGMAYTYLYVRPFREDAEQVKEGDWVTYYKQDVALKNLLQNAEIL